MLMGHYAGYLYVNLTQDGVILEDGTSTEEPPPMRLTCGQTCGMFY